MRRDVSAGICEVDCIDGCAVASARAGLPPERDVATAAATLRVIGNPARIRLLLALERHELCVCDCATLLGQSLSSASQHLKELRQIGAVRFRQDGKLAFYRLADDRLVELIHALMAPQAESRRA